MLVKEGNIYCGEHAVHSAKNESRILCPNDPKHTVIREELKKHLKKCSARVIEKPWIVENINAMVKETKSFEKIDRRPTVEEIEAVMVKIDLCYGRIEADIAKEVRQTERDRDNSSRFCPYPRSKQPRSKQSVLIARKSLPSSVQSSAMRSRTRSS